MSDQDDFYKIGSFTIRDSTIFTVGMIMGWLFFICGMWIGW